VCLKITYFFTSSVACAIGPSVNTFFIFHIFRIKNLKLWQCEHIESSTEFSFQTQFFAIYLSFQRQSSLKNQYLLHLSSQDCEINSIKSDASKAFQERPQIPIQFSVSILSSFHWENDPIINSFLVLAPNRLKPSGCNPLFIKSFPKTIKSVAWSIVV